MSSRTIASIFKLKRISDTSISTSNDVLAIGEPLICLETRTLYIGDGSTAIKDLVPFTCGSDISAVQTNKTITFNG